MNTEIIETAPGAMDRQQEANAEKESQTHAEPFTMRRNIRSTTYEVTVYFSKTSRETLTDKIRRLIRNEIRQ
jgi:hypothetical protein